MRDIRLDKEGVPSRLCDQPDGFFAFGCTTSRNDHAGAFPGKRDGGRTSDARVSSGD
jgi:hypothetical protein